MRGNAALQKERNKQEVQVYEREMKEVQKRDAYQKIKQGIAASKEEGEHPNLITGNKTSAVAVQKEKQLNK